MFKMFKRSVFLHDKHYTITRLNVSKNAVYQEVKKLQDFFNAEKAMEEFPNYNLEKLPTIYQINRTRVRNLITYCWYAGYTDLLKTLYKIGINFLQEIDTKTYQIISKED